MARPRADKLLKTGKQIKRNVVSLITQNEGGVSAVKLSSGLLLLLLFSLSLPNNSLAANLEIQQKKHRYQLPFAQVILTETFVISTASRSIPAKTVITEKSIQTTPAPGAHFSNPILAHFNIDSAEIAPEEQTKLLTRIHETKVSPNTPLTVTGFTCTKGPAKFNAWLSAERAKAVAGLLEKEGYIIAKIEGKGASSLVNANYAPLNRRVEITPFKTSSARTGQSIFSSKEATQ